MLKTTEALKALWGDINSENTPTGQWMSGNKEAIKAMRYDIATLMADSMRFLKLSVAPEIQSALILDIETGGINRFAPILQIAMGNVQYDKETGQLIDDTASFGNFKELNIIPVSHQKNTTWVADVDQEGRMNPPDYRTTRILGLDRETFGKQGGDESWVFGNTPKAKSFAMDDFFKAIEGMSEAEVRDVFNKGYVEVPSGGGMKKFYTPRQASIQLLEQILEQASKNGAVIAANILFESERVFNMIGSYLQDDQPSNLRYTDETEIRRKDGSVFIIKEEAINEDPRLTKYFDNQRITGLDNLKEKFSAAYKSNNKSNILDPNQIEFKNAVAKMQAIGMGQQRAGFIDRFRSALATGPKGLRTVEAFDLTSRTLYSAAGMIMAPQAEEALYEGTRGLRKGFHAKAALDDVYTLTKVQYMLTNLFGGQQAHTALSDVQDTVNIINKVSPATMALADIATLKTKGGIFNELKAFALESYYVANPETRREMEDAWKLFADRTKIIEFSSYSNKVFGDGKSIKTTVMDAVKITNVEKAMYQLLESMKVWTAEDIEAVDSRFKPINIVRSDTGRVLAYQINEGFSLTQNKTSLVQYATSDGSNVEEIRTASTDINLSKRARDLFQAKRSEVLNGLQDQYTVRSAAEELAFNTQANKEAFTYAFDSIAQEYLETPSMKASGFNIDQLRAMADEIASAASTDQGNADVYSRLIANKSNIDDELIEKGKASTQNLIGTFQQNYMQKHRGKVIAGAVGGAVALGAMTIGVVNNFRRNQYTSDRVNTLDALADRSEVNQDVYSSTEGVANVSVYSPTKVGRIVDTFSNAIETVARYGNKNVNSSTSIEEYSTASRPARNMNSDMYQTNIDLSQFKMNFGDADTLDLEHKSNPNIKHSIRLSGVDTPETQHTKSGLVMGEGNFGMPMGAEASMYSKNLMASSADPGISIVGKDNYNRNLGVLSGASGQNINLQLVQSGMGQALPWGPQKVDTINQKDFLYAEKVAQQAEEGIWSLPYYEKYRAATPSRFAKRTFNTISKIDPQANTALLAVMQSGTLEQASRFRDVRKNDPRLNQEIYQELFQGNGDSSELEALGHKGIAWQIRQQMTEFGSGYKGIKSEALYGMLKADNKAEVDTLMKDNTYLTLANTMQRNPGRNRSRRS